MAKVIKPVFFSGIYFLFPLYLNCFLAQYASAQTWEYQLNQPSEVFSLPKSLQEISGLTWLSSGKLLALQDEKARIYQLNIKEKRIEKTIDFAKDGDYEGIEIWGDDIFCLRSDGKIYQISSFRRDDFEVTKYKTDLDEKNDPEGLAYDATRKELWIACKASAFIDKKTKKKRGLYRFRTLQKDVGKEPSILIDVESLSIINKKVNDFAPSALAFHPINGNIYILSSIGKSLLVLNRKGEVLALEKLPKNIYPQPEGICFDPQGRMYISNEAKDDAANILTILRKD